jgi:hypothetical protein
MRGLFLRLSRAITPPAFPSADPPTGASVPFSPVPSQHTSPLITSCDSKVGILSLSLQRNHKFSFILLPVSPSLSNGATSTYWISTLILKMFTTEKKLFASPSGPITPCAAKPAPLRRFNTTLSLLPSDVKARLLDDSPLASPLDVR